MNETLTALLLGLLEGLTEFIPVSSTGHLLLAGHFLGFRSAGRTFEVVIQLGAVLAILGVYAAKISRTVRGLPSDPGARRFAGSVLLAFLPAMVVGVLAHDVIKTVLFESPRLIATMLILGGVVLLRCALVVRRRVIVKNFCESQSKLRIVEIRISAWIKLLAVRLN